MPGVELSDRESTILKAVIEGHIGSAKPVSSSAVVRLSSVSLSSATVRSVMRALEEKGLILQPHTSAGRVPTDLGYRYYVDHLVRPADVSERERDEIDAALASLVHCDLGTILAGISHMVSELSKELAVAVAPSGGGRVIEKLDLVSLGGGRVLAVAITDTGPTRTAVIATGNNYARSELDRATRLLNDWLASTPFAGAADRIEKRSSEHEPPLEEPLAWLLDGVRSFLALGAGERIHYEGTRYIFRHPELVRDAASLGEIFDSEEMLADVVRGPSGSTGISVVIGHENTREGLSHMSLVTGTYRLGSSIARMGVIGPTRMRYPRLMGLVGHFSSVLDGLFAERRRR